MWCFGFFERALAVNSRWLGLLQKGHAHLGGGYKGDSWSPAIQALLPSLGGGRALAVQPWDGGDSSTEVRVAIGCYVCWET